LAELAAKKEEFMKLILLVIAMTQFANPLMYPQHDKTPGATNALVTQANIQDNICKKGFSTLLRRRPPHLARSRRQSNGSPQSLARADQQDARDAFVRLAG
jgi:hypothetical protein